MRLQLLNTFRRFGLLALAFVPLTVGFATAPDYDAALRQRWLEIAESLKPSLARTVVAPVGRVQIVADSRAWQGWRAERIHPAANAGEQGIWPRRESRVFDFGEHRVGYLRFAVRSPKGFNDAPVRLHFVFGESATEVAEPFEPYSGQLSRAWLQDATIDVDVLPAVVTLPRRYAFRYVKITVVDTSPEFDVAIDGLACATVSAAGPLPAPVAGLPDDLRKIDHISLRTLQDCMQTVFEDGPKRDRRLWLGDLRLQALSNEVSFRNFALVKRCLYLFAGLAREDGVVTACVYEEPKPTIGHCSILDYAALFGPTLLDYARASGDWETARDLWLVARRQIDYCLQYVDRSGLFQDPGNWWLFIDWHPKLDRQAALQGTILYAIHRNQELARELQLAGDVAHWEERAAAMTRAARTQLWDPQAGLFASGRERQLSWASQVWLVLGGVVAGDDAASLLRRMRAHPTALKPVTPYLYHHVVHALVLSGLREEALALLRDYWGAMATNGADTFWEVFDPANPRLTPYGNALMNSHCHAWSCTPAWFLRTPGLLAPSL